MNTASVTASRVRSMPPRAVRATARRIVLPRELNASPASPRSSHTEIFSRIVAERVDGAGVLRYDDRVKLLRAAGRLGISRFDANVLIASAQHRAGDGRAKQRAMLAAAGQPPARAAATPMHFVACAMIVQVGILLAGWWIIA